MSWVTRLLNLVATPRSTGPSEEQIVEQKLVDCGLKRSGLSVSYVDDWRSVVAVINDEAEARAEHFDCIRDAVWPQEVRFESPELERSYLRFRYGEKYEQ